MNKKLIFIIFILTFLIFPINSMATTFNDNSVVNKDKIWTITFNQNIILDDLTKKGVTVTDNNNNVININLSFGENKQIIKVTPTNNYVEGQQYQLVVNNNIHSEKNQNFKKVIKMNFSVVSTDVAIFKNPILASLVKNLVNASSNNLWKTDVQNITNIEYSNDTLYRPIDNLDGMENLTHIESCTIDGGGFSDISSLKNLTNLKTLSLNDNQISDISSLYKLTYLQDLSLYNNQITDVSSLKQLVGLNNINLSYNTIKNITSLSSLSNLQSLSLYNNEIQDISPLKSLTNLNFVYLNNNQISDISSLNTLTNLESLYLDYNQVTDISALQQLTNLKFLSLSNNPISDITPLKTLVNLEYLSLDDTKIADISTLNTLTNLKTLYLHNIKINAASKKALTTALPKCKIIY